MPRAFVAYELVHYHLYLRYLPAKWCKSVIVIPQNHYNYVIEDCLTALSAAAVSYGIHGRQSDRGHGKRSIRAEVSGPA